jgi:hypothetical protein
VLTPTQEGNTVPNLRRKSSVGHLPGKVSPVSMKKLVPHLFLLVAFAPALPNPATAESSPADSGAVRSADADRLWIAVGMPKSTSPDWVAQQTAATFADIVVKSLLADGFKGKTGTLHLGDSTPVEASVLVVRLKQWTAEDGFANCTFSASLRTAEGDRDLGVFVGDNCVVTADGKHPVSSDGLLGAAEESMHHFYRRIQETGLLAVQ